MKKGTFKIENILTGKVEVDGLVSRYFGMYKIDPAGGYAITHLPTGCLVCTANKMSQAREIVKLLETAAFPCQWDSDDVDGLKLNAATTASIINSVLYGDK
jgi:hypothetical protein